MDWRNDKPTDAQLLAIKNKAQGFNITAKNVKTKGEAFDEIQRLDKIIDNIVTSSNHDGYGMSAADEWAYEVGYGPFY